MSERGLSLRRHPSDWFDVNLQTGEKRGPLEPDDPAYPPAFKLDRGVYLDGVLIAYCKLAKGVPITLLPNRVLPKPSDSEKAQIREFVESHIPAAADGSAVSPGAVVDAPPLVKDPRAPQHDEPVTIDDLEDEEDSDDVE